MCNISMTIHCARLHHKNTSFVSHIFNRLDGEVSSDLNLFTSELGKWNAVTWNFYPIYDTDGKYIGYHRTFDIVYIDGDVIDKC